MDDFAQLSNVIQSRRTVSQVFPVRWGWEVKTLLSCQK